MKKRKKLIISSVIVLVLLITLGTAALIVSAEYLSSIFKSKIINANVEDTPGNAPAGTYPVILLHGLHLTYNQRISEFTFKEMQNSLQVDLEYRDVGLYTEQITCSELKYETNPIIIRATYLTPLEFETIDEYSENVEEIIDRIIFCTGAEKVDVVAHSMGGIVARNYILNSENPRIRKLIMLGTPNNGGLYNIAEIADILTVNGDSLIDLDFIQLSEDNKFMKTLNQKTQYSSEVEFFTIAGNKDGKGDGIVKEESVKLENATHNTVNCGHLNLKDPSDCPEAYNKVKEALG